MSHQDFSSYPIMLVDDETDALSLLKSFLNHEGFDKVVTFDDSLHALEYFKSQELSLVVIDLRMPRLHGRELLEAFAELKPYIPVIVVTAECQIETAIN